jgi:predicted Zn-dependent protease with MMP-like domain
MIMAKQIKRKKGFCCGLRSFELLVKEAVTSLPEEIKKNLENVAIIIEEDFPDKKKSKENQELLGLYHGVPKRERGFWYGNTLPDRIVIFKRPLERISTHWEELKENIRRTVFHEVGHYFGLSEDDLRSLEEE